MIRNIMMLGAMLIVAMSSSAKAVELVSNGIAKSVIVLTQDTNTTERTAAYELQKHLEQISGAKIPIVPGALKEAGISRIFVGQTADVKRRLSGVDWDALKFDGIIIKSAGTDLFIAGDRPRGTLYAAYTFLESLGVRFLAPDETKIPQTDSVVVPALDIQYTPALKYREVTYKRVVRQNPEFCAKLKLNGHHHPIPPQYGGNLSIIGFVHTFDTFMPAAKYMKEHPEWMSLKGGRRIGGQHLGQLCLTNEDMRKEFARQVLEQIAKNPEAGLISVSQNDGAGPCECENCKAAVARLGNQSDLLIQFVNDIAVEVGRKYPDFLVETLAYTYTREAPKTVVPEKNVLIRLCSIEADFSKPLDSEANASFMKDIKAWGKLTDKLFIWDYTVGFSNLHLPYPNTQVLAANVRTFVENNTIGLHEQGDMYNPDVSMQPLKLYLLAKLAWDPDIDEDKVTREFLEDYYGAAGVFLYDYVKLLEKAVEDHPTKLVWNQMTAPYLGAAELVKAFNLLESAEKAVDEDPRLLKKVKLQKMALEQAWFRIPFRVRKEASKNTQLDEHQVLKDYIERAEETGNIFIGENRKFNWDDFAIAAVGDSMPMPGPLPERLKDLPESDWKNIRLTRANLPMPDLASFVEDSHAASGSAIRAVGSTNQWAIQFIVLPFDLVDFEKAEVIVSIKCTDRGSAGKAFEAGIYDAVNRKVISEAFELTKIADDNYHEYSLGTHELNEGMYIYIAPPGLKGEIGYLHLDKIYLVNAEGN